MKILHVCLSSHYTVGMSYQDNLLPDQNALDGHEVLVISDCFEYRDGKLEEATENDFFLRNGVRVVRLPYDRILNKFISGKVRKVSGFRYFLSEFQPDLILYHGACGYELLTVSIYKFMNPSVKLYVDSHQDFNNSGGNFLSYIVQYKVFNRFIVSRARKFVDKFLYISMESKYFLKKAYGLTDSEMEFYPLGGLVVAEEEKLLKSRAIRSRYDISHDDILIVHSGKFEEKKKTLDLLRAFSVFDDSNFKLFLVGSLSQDIAYEAMRLVDRDDRVKFLGWMNSDDLLDHLCAADLYFQPGTQSATLQAAICCGTPVAVYPYESHYPYIQGNGFFVSGKDEYIKVFETIAHDRGCLVSMSHSSFAVARSLLDYKKLAGRLYA